MDKNTIIGILLIGVIFIGYSYFNNSRLEKAYNTEIVHDDSLFHEKDYGEAITSYRKALSFRPRETYPQQQIDEINQIMGFDREVPDTVAGENDEGSGESQVDKTLQQADISRDVPLNLEKFGSFAQAVEGEPGFITLENNLLKLRISKEGGRLYSAELKNYHTYDTLPLILFDGDSTVLGLQFFTFDNHPIETNNLFFVPQTDKQHLMVTDQPVSLTMRLDAGEGRFIDYVYSMKPDDYMIDFDLKISGMKDVFARNLNSLDLSWELYMPCQEKGRQNEDYYAGFKYKYYQDEVDGSRERSNKDVEEQEVSTRIRWMAFKDQFFSSVLIADDPFLNAWVRSEKTPNMDRYLRFYQTKLSIPYNGEDEETFKMHFYLGPNHFKTLKKYNIGLENLVFLGRNIIRWINEYVIINIFNWLNRSIANYGLIILLLTIIIKMALFPLTFKSYISQAKMRVLKPQVDEINSKYPKKEDAMKKQQATMALYKQVGVSPLGGCLPMILQMPILFAMFRFFPTSIELRQQQFLWATDLSTYDSILTLPWDIPMYGDHISLFTILMTVSTIVTMKINTPAQTGSAQMPGMKGMMYMMPIMFMVILNNFSAGLTYYYFLANMITFAQNLITKQFVNEEDILKKLESSKKKPVKKSGWQKRLEVAAKARGHKPPKKR